MTPREKAKGLIELAADESTSEEERFSSAVKACALIRKYDLLSSPLDSMNDNKTVKAARKIFDAFSDPEVKGSLKDIGDVFKGAAEKAKRRRE